MSSLSISRSCQGAITAFVGSEEIAIATGSTALLPRGVPHTYAVDTGEARVVAVNSPCGFAGMFADLAAAYRGEMPDARSAGWRSWPPTDRPAAVREPAHGGDHLTRVYGKLEIASRDKLAAALARQASFPAQRRLCCERPRDHRQGVGPDTA